MNENEILLSIVTPKIYQENPFRILGLSINATAKDIIRKTHALETKLDLKIEFNEQDRGIFPLKNAPNKDSINKACEDVKNPTARIIYVLFWFWPLKQQNDEGFILLSKGRYNDALTFWRKNEREDNNGIVAKHNLAIIYHLTAIDLEGKIEDGTAKKTEINNYESYWKSALARWHTLVGNDKFWRVIEEHILAIGDPRVTTDTNKNIRQILPKALLRINGQIAVNAAKRSDSVAVKRQLQIINESEFDSDIIQQVQRDVTKPIIEQIRLLCSLILEKAKQSPSEANKIIKAMLIEIKSLLLSLDLLLSYGSTLKERCCDEVASILRECIVTYGNETTDWKECLDLSHEAANIAVGKLLKERVDDDIVSLKRNLQLEEEQTKREEEHKRSINSNDAFEVTVTGNRIAVPPVCTCCLKETDDTQSTSYSWTEQKALSKVERTVSFSFPTCTECKKHQSELSAKRFIMIIITLIISIGLLFLIGSQSERYEYIIYILFGTLISLVALCVLNFILRVREMPDVHSSRDEAVTMNNANPGLNYVTFRFSNYLYALAFAKVNNKEITKIQRLKYSRKSSLLRGRSAFQIFIWIAVLSFIGNSITYAILDENNWTSKDYYETSTYNRSTSSYNRKNYNYSQDSGTLLRQINAGKQTIEQMKNELEEMSSNLKTMKSRMDSLKVNIRKYESDTTRGAYVNAHNYQQVIDEHNTLVRRYNSILGEYKEKHEKYEEELKRVNDLIDRYNRGSR